MLLGLTGHPVFITSRQLVSRLFIKWCKVQGLYSLNKCFADETVAVGIRVSCREHCSY